MQTLVIFGDSWGCGEWSYSYDSLPHVSHPGLSEYLSDTFVVKNFSRPGASLWQTVYAIGSYLANLRNLDVPMPVILVIQTDAGRNYQAEKFHIDYDHICRSGKSLVEIYQTFLQQWYIKLQFLAKRFNTEIYLCGGLTDLYTAALKPHTRLHVVCDSWLRLCDPDTKSSIMPLIMSPEMVKYLHDNHDPSLTQQMMDWLDEAFLPSQNLLESPWMGPGVRNYHPNRLAHQRLSDHIKQFFREQSQ